MTTHPGPPPVSVLYEQAFLDWLACACAGADSRAARAAKASGDDLLSRVTFVATAGHVHDFDDTFSDGVAHVSATCAPPALVLAADRGASLAEALSAYAAGFEVMAATAKASHPSLYSAGWHPTAVCGSIGSAVVAARLFGLTEEQEEQAVRLAVVRTGGTRGAFGSDAKAIGVGLAAAHGVQAARLAQGGATVSERVVSGELGFEGVFGATRAVADPHASAGLAIERNWIKRYPSCLERTPRSRPSSKPVSAVVLRVGRLSASLCIRPLVRRRISTM